MGMAYRFYLLLLVVFSAGAVAGPTISILHTNDLHQSLAPLPALAGYAKAYKAEHPATVFIDAGDWFDRGSALCRVTRGEAVTAEGEELAAEAVSLALPEERHRIAGLLAVFPEQRETKIEKLLRGLGALWKQNAGEKIVIFATYLATVDLLSREIENAYPGQGVVILRGGDHGAKLAAERRFKRKDGPRVLVCTAAGREGTNLQFARVLFNFDLPWNPMDLEQRIGRIHRYGQKDTAQVYNLVLGDTLDDRIELLGIDHPAVSRLVQTLCNLPPTKIGASVRMGLDQLGVVTVWQVQVYGKGSESGTHIIAIAADTSGKRVPSLEKRYAEAFRAAPAPAHLEPAARERLLHDNIEPMLVREINHRGLSTPEGGYSSKLLAWLEVV